MMAITLNTDGSIRVDTAEELRVALEVQASRNQQAASQGRKPVATPPPEDAASTAAGPRVTRVFPEDRAEKYQQLYRQLGKEAPQQQALLKSLMAGPKSDDDLRRELDLDRNEDLRGLLIGLVRRAKNQDLGSPIVKVITRTHSGRKRTYLYSMSREARAALDGVAVNVQQRLAV